MLYYMYLLHSLVPVLTGNVCEVVTFCSYQTCVAYSLGMGWCWGCAVDWLLPCLLGFSTSICSHHSWIQNWESWWLWSVHVHVYRGSRSPQEHRNQSRPYIITGAYPFTNQRRTYASWSLHKPIGIYMGDLILGVIIVHAFCCFCTLCTYVLGAIYLCGFYFHGRAFPPQAFIYTRRLTTKKNPLCDSL